MWRPGFEAEEVVHARLVGWRRSFCIYSRFHRGSDRRPGLVLGLDRGGMCEGIAFRVSASNARQTLRYLREREQVGSVYREALVPVTLLTGERPEVMALAFLVERAHPSYAGDLPLAEQAHVIRGGIGRSGNNIDYLASTLAHLAALGIRERPLERLQAIIGTFAARGPGDRHTRATAASMVRVFGRRPAHARRLKAEDLQRFCYRTVLTARDE
jgi:cation transport protein ChaC